MLCYYAIVVGQTLECVLYGPLLFKREREFDRPFIAGFSFMRLYVCVIYVVAPVMYISCLYCIHLFVTSTLASAVVLELSGCNLFHLLIYDLVHPGNNAYETDSWCTKRTEC